MVERLLSIAFFVGLVGCLAPASRVQLTPAEATRIAEAMLSSGPRPLGEFRRSAATYDASTDGWWIAYHELKPHYGDFSVLVADKTKKASLVRP
jgi:hypothetical protein